ncbi:MAG: PDZ domain-containing protein [Bacteroides sp.]
MKQRNVLLMGLLMAAQAATAVPTDEARLLRFPATNGEVVLFSFAGDLYSAPIAGGEARRLTAHVGNEIFARFSPDGRTVAFSAQYDGNTEVYTIPAEGGEPMRLTYTQTNERDDLGDRMGPNNVVMTWSPDGKQILFRNRTSDGFIGQLWSVSPQGGMATALPLPEGGFCSYSPDGKQLAYNRVFREFRTWKYYRGGMADDIWIYDAKQKQVTNITENIAQDIFPMWIGEEIFFASDRNMTMNLFCYNTRTRQTEQVTHFTDYDVKFPSTDGKLIVFEKGGYLYKFDPKTRQSEQIHITLHADNLQARTERIHVADRITAADLSADGQRVYVTARGEVFDVPVKEGITRCLTRTPGAHERDAVVSPDGKQIAYISDRTGETELWLQAAEGGEPRQLTKDNDTYIRSIQWTPDGKWLLYTDRKNRLVRVDAVTAAKEVLLTCPEQEFWSVAVSPDSRWLSYTRPAANQMSVVYLYELATKREIAVTERWYNSDLPAFSQDGKYLIFSADRDFNPSYGRLEWNHIYNRMGGIYIAMLQKQTPSPLLPRDSEVKGAAEEAAPQAGKAAGKGQTPGKGAGKEAADSKKAPAEVKVDAEGLTARIVKLPVGAGYYGNFYCDGKRLWYSSGGTKVYDFESREESKVSDAQMSVCGERALFFSRREGKIYVADRIPTGRFNAEKAVDLSQLVATVDYPQEWAQIFDEAWRAYRDGFYLENMHGVDWKAIKAKYAVLLPYVKSRLDLNYVIGEMISELACGHAYVNPGQYPKAQRIPMGLLGAELQADKSGYFRIGHILQGAPYSESLRSPLAEPGLGISEGDYITAVDGVSTRSVDNIYKLLIGKAGVLTELTVNSRAAEGGRKVVVKPIADEYPLTHYEWVQRNIATVEKASGGRIGYIYIPDMGPEGLNEFARYFYPQLDKEALIIDDRANGGGNVSPMIIERLLRKPYRMTMSRTSTQVGTIPDATHVGPKVLLINKYSASDGDLFPWSFKANELGTVIGTRTWGGIVGISGSLPYLDGTDIRVPFFTNYDAKTGQWIVENHGVDPDILIDNDPIREAAGEDQQLLKAIEVALQQLKERKPLPGVPAPRTFKDLGL